MRAVCVVVGLCGCGLELGPSSAWIDARDVTGALAPEIGAPPMALVPVTEIRVVTFNVEKGADVAQLANAIQSTPALASATLLLIQEIESHPGEGGSRASRLAAALGMGYVYAPERLEGDGTHGPAILSRWPLDNVREMKLAYAEQTISRAPRIALGADVRIGNDTVHLVDLHLDTRLNVGQRILQMRPAVLDAEWPTIVGGDLNTNPYAWIDEAVPQLPAGSIVDTDQAPALDDYMRSIDYDTPTAELGPTLLFAGLVEARLDSIFTRGVIGIPGAVERSVSVSDHWPVYIDVELTR